MILFQNFLPIILSASGVNLSAFGMNLSALGVNLSALGVIRYRGNPAFAYKYGIKAGLPAQLARIGYGRVASHYEGKFYYKPNSNINPKMINKILALYLLAAAIKL